MPRISVLFPVHIEHPNLGVAIDCLRTQSFEDLEILFLANGPHAPSKERLFELSQEDARVSVITLEHPQLAATLNVGIRAARGELIARMDGDDRCTPDRLQRQYEALAKSPQCIAVNGAYACVSVDGTVRGICLPPANPSEAWWKLHLQNIYAHGAMMMRRDALVRENLLYNEEFDRAQDYELWLRMGPRVTSVQEVVYSFTTCADTYSSSPLQAKFAARCISQAWNGLPAGDPLDYQEFLAQGMLGEQEAAAALRGVQERLTALGPTKGGLMAYQWLLARVKPPASAHVDREGAVKHAAGKLVGEGVSEVYLWGAGAHTTWAVPILREQGIRVLGIVDDFVAGQERCGMVVRDPKVIPEGSHVLVSSERAENEIVQRARVVRGPAVHVHTIYAAA